MPPEVNAGGLGIFTRADRKQKSAITLYDAEVRGQRLHLLDAHGETLTCALRFPFLDYSNRAGAILGYGQISEV